MPSRDSRLYTLKTFTHSLSPSHTHIHRIDKQLTHAKLYSNILSLKTWATRQTAPKSSFFHSQWTFLLLECTEEEVEQFTNFSHLKDVPCKYRISLRGYKQEEGDSTWGNNSKTKKILVDKKYFTFRVSQLLFHRVAINKILGRKWFRIRIPGEFSTLRNWNCFVSFGRKYEPSVLNGAGS